MPSPKKTPVPPSIQGFFPKNIKTLIDRINPWSSVISAGANMEIGRQEYAETVPH